MISNSNNSKPILQKYSFRRSKHKIGQNSGGSIALVNSLKDNYHGICNLGVLWLILTQVYSVLVS